MAISKWMLGLGLATALVLATVGLSARQDSASIRVVHSVHLLHVDQTALQPAFHGRLPKLAQQPQVLHVPATMPSIPKTMTSRQLGPSGDGMTNLSLVDLRHVIQQNGSVRALRL